MTNKPAFLITIDTEGDNIWDNPKNVAVKNANYIERFQKLCEKYNFKPTYLTNYEMAHSEDFIKFGRKILKNEAGEIGMHLHAWNTPPFYEAIDNKSSQPYLIEYPEKIMRDKISSMTELLESKFQTKMISHRAGRWAFNEAYAKILIEKGYLVDCSVTPNISWENEPGAGEGGSDYTNFPEYGYFLNANDISKQGDSPLLELPMTIDKCKNESINNFRKKINHIAILRKPLTFLFPETTWLRPDGRNLVYMRRLVDKAIKQKREFIEFMLHSSEFMPGGSPTFPSKDSIENLFQDLDKLFKHISGFFKGYTLKEYHSKAIGK